MKVCLLPIAMLIAMAACASSTPATVVDGAETGDAGSVRYEPDAALQPSPDAGEPKCWIGEGDFGTNDALLGGAFDEAKRACDDELGWACGEIMVALGVDGCVIGASSGGLEVTGGPAWLACLADKLAASCSRCERSETRRFYESCTIL